MDQQKTGNKEDNVQKSSEPKGTIKSRFQSILKEVRLFLKEILDISSDTDVSMTIEMIRKDISFKGHNSWILICSIMIASVGLNANSPAVVIGAMLISPLMGPILGIGMAIAIHDIDTLKRSLLNFALMVGLSVLTAFLFFALFPLKIESSELLARTSPDVRDVLIAFFGGLALIIARTKTGTIASVIFGVAIATALMPPLCTAGYGLAVGNFPYFRGALYLFTINTIYIAFATFIVLKILNFPMDRYANSLKRRRIVQAVSFLAFLIMIPAVWTFYNVFQESLYRRQAEEFVDHEIKSFYFDDGKFISNLTQFDYNRDGESVISLVFLGEEVVTPEIEMTWKNKLRDPRYSKLKNTKIEIAQGSKNEIAETAVYVEKLYEEAVEELGDKEEEIENLQSEVKNLRKQTIENIPFDLVLNECEALFPEITSLAYNTRLIGNNAKIDTSLVFITTWEENADANVIAERNARLSNWLKTRLGKNNIQVSSQ